MRRSGSTPPRTLRGCSRSGATDPLPASEATAGRPRSWLLLVAVVAVRLLASVAPAGDATLVTNAAAAAPVTVHSPLAYGSSGTPVPAGATYVVQPGDTVWSIAEQLAPNGDVRGMVDRLVDLNGGAALEVGQHLLLS